MSLQTPHLDLPLLAAAQAQKHVTHNEALLILDSLTQIGVLDWGATPPDNPAIGARYLVIAPATGLFSGQEKNIAAFEEGGWRFMAPQCGWLAYVASESRIMVFDGAEWKDAPTRAASIFGVNASADTVNRLSVASPGVLFNHEGADVQVKLNKAQHNNTASLLYQDCWSGRAEIGLCGDDNLSLKVSPDGQNWKIALIADRTSGAISFPRGVAAGDRTGFRNRLRNASFAINQRNISGATTLGAGQYGHDGVKAGANGATYAFTTRGIDTTLTVSAGSLILPIEGAWIEGGGYCLSHDGTAQARVWQQTGGGTYAAAASGGLMVSGLTAGAQTNVEFTTGTILRPQFECGGVATAFERRPPATELALCQYYFTSYVFPTASAMQFSGYVSAANQFAIVQFTYPRMRAAPTLVRVGTWALSNVAQFMFGAPQAACVYAALYSAGPGYVIVYSPANGGFTLSAEL